MFLNSKLPKISTIRGTVTYNMHIKYELNRMNRLDTSPTCGGVVTLKTGKRGVQGSNPGRACRPSRSEFSVVFSETRVNMG